MTVPDAVRKAGQEADQALAEIEKTQQESMEQPSLLDEAAGKAEGTEQTPAEAEAQPLPDPPLIAEDAPAAPQQSPEEMEKLMQRYRTLKGKYDKEVPRLHQEVHQMQAQLAETLKQQKAVPQIDPEKLKPSELREVLKGVMSEDELETLGDEALMLYGKMVYGIASQMDAKATAEMQEELARLRNKVAQDSVRDFWNDVERQFPGAQELNANDTGWADFLDSTDPLSGLAYRDIGARAMAEGDASRVVALMRLYAGNGSESQVIDNKVKETPVVKPSQTAVTSQPDSRRSNEVPAIRESEIQLFYSDVARGKYAGRETERAKKEKLIEDAVSAGRVMLG